MVILVLLTFTIISRLNTKNIDNLTGIKLLLGYSRFRVLSKLIYTGILLNLIYLSGHIIGYIIIVILKNNNYLMYYNTDLSINFIIFSINLIITLFITIVLQLSILFKYPINFFIKNENIIWKTKKEKAKNEKKILISVSIIIIVILSIISINEIKKRSKETSDNEFVKKYLNYLNNGDIEIDFTDVTLYFKSEKIYLEIVYEYKYKEYQGTQRFLANKLTDQFVQGGFENSYPEFIIEFNDVKINHSRKKTYSKKEIKNLLDK